MAKITKQPEPFELLDRQRRAMGYTLDDVCAAIGISKQTYGRRIACPGNVTIGELRRFSKFLKISGFRRDEIIISVLGGLSTTK